LSSSDIVAERGDRAAAWLEKSADLGRVAPREVHYWRGRLAELRERPADAMEHYLDAIREAPYDPFAQAARQRLARPALAAAVLAKTEALAASTRSGEVYDAWLLLPALHPRRPAVRRYLEEKLAAADRSARVFLRLRVQPASDWPLWSSRLERPEEMLLALGLFHEGGSMVLRYFPVARPELAFTGSLVLARTGDTRRSLYIAEILSKRVPGSLPEPLLPIEFRQLLYPSAYRNLIRREADRRRIDPHLLAAIIREESRFDPRAFSAASARGLTQFVFPTAREVAARQELGPVAPRDLEIPEVSIALGAAYLRQLYDHFESSLPEVVAAYNAGEPQARLWRRYCVSGEAEEYLTKVAFRETRNYLSRVLTSREHYRDLYPIPPPETAARH
jgi:soluble lytic murein transglycosylase